MARYEHLPIYKKAFELTLETRNKAEALLRTVQRGSASCKIMRSKYNIF